MLATILRAWRSTVAPEREYGRSWYWREREWCRCIAYNTGLPLSRVCGIYAALSPNQGWMDNRAAVVRVTAGHWKGLSNYGRDVMKAMLIHDFADDPARILNGRKTQSFFRLLLDGGNEIDVCVDGHIVNMARDQHVPLKQMHLSREQYEEIADEIRLAAMIEGERPCDLQATLWWAWRRSPRLRQHSIIFA